MEWCGGTGSAVRGAVGSCNDACAAGCVGRVGGSSTSMISGICVFRRVFHWCMQGVSWRTPGHVGFLDGVNLEATLRDGVASTLGGVVLSTLCGSVLSNHGGVATSPL